MCKRIFCLWIFLSLCLGSQVLGGHLLIDFNGIGEGDISDPAILTYQGISYLDRSLPAATWWNGLQVASANTISGTYHGPDNNPDTLYYTDGSVATGITITLSDWDGQDRTAGGGDTFNALLKDYLASDNTSYITVGGLTPGQAYDVVGYSSNGPDGLGAYWTANGVGPVDLTLGVANVGVMRGVVADGEGKIVISCDHDPLEAAPLTIVNGFEIKEAAALPADTSYLTEIGLTRANEDGSMDIRERYNTFWYDGAWSVVVYEGAFMDPNHSEPNDVLNYPVDYSVNIPLAIGEEKTFHFYFTRANPDGSADVAYWGMNFFFNDQQYLQPAKAGISVLAYMDTDPNVPHPGFAANSNEYTMGYPYDPGIAGSGSLSFVDVKAFAKVTLTDFFVYYQDVWNADVIRRDDDFSSPPASGPDGTIDCVGQFTLKSEAYIPTCLDQNEYMKADLNQDCFVNLADLALLAGDWLTCNDPQGQNCTPPFVPTVLRVDFNGYYSYNEPNNALWTYEGPGLLGKGTFWNGVEVSYLTPNAISAIYPGPGLLLDDGVTDSQVTIMIAGNEYGDRADTCPDKLLADYLLGYHPGVMPPDPNIIITISGLIPGNSYRLAGYGANAFDHVGGFWTVNGVQTLDLTYFVADSGILENVIADAEGKIVIEIAEDPLGNYHYTVVNGLELEGTFHAEPIRTCQSNGFYEDLDLNEDCYVNLGDYAVVAGRWLDCNDPQDETCTATAP